jgi:hypothetical protein
MHRKLTYFATLIVAAGCGGPAHTYDAVVTGTVTINGELAKAGLVTFHPLVDGKDGKVAIGRIHPDGSYSLRTGQGDLRQVDGGTVVPGDYIVTVSITAPPAEGSRIAEGGPSIAGPSLVAAKYGSKETSDLKRTVVAGNQIIVLELEPADPTSPAEMTGATAAPASSEAQPKSASAVMTGGQPEAAHNSLEKAVEPSKP